MAKIRVGPEILSRQGAETGRRYRDRRLEEGGGEDRFNDGRLVQITMGSG
ncbi:MULTISPECIES: hypothetical protein [Paenibacillus]|uniref:Uncharacterized protein n=1 Tax=Paenibacillus lactis TaxID=228574 RepID=A0ABS4FII6_9BACL|nr:hypothetical protein [Paenibacillus lactis]MBP1896068.1 hypothetical protein [Paenibacillus lactis]MCM3495522.1 hypothetical protein [Paenibacillus lactis]